MKLGNDNTITDEDYFMIEDEGDDQQKVDERSNNTINTMAAKHRNNLS